MGLFNLPFDLYLDSHWACSSFFITDHHHTLYCFPQRPVHDHPNNPILLRVCCDRRKGCHATPIFLIGGKPSSVISISCLLSKALELT